MAWRKWGLGLLTMAYPLVIYFGLQHYSPRVMALALLALAVIVPAAVPVALSRPATWADLPWAPLLALALAAAGIGWLTARLTVGRWLRRLP